MLQFFQLITFNNKMGLIRSKHGGIRRWRFGNKAFKFPAYHQRNAALQQIAAAMMKYKSLGSYSKRKATSAQRWRARHGMPKTAPTHTSPKYHVISHHHHAAAPPPPPLHPGMGVVHHISHGRGLVHLPVAKRPIPSRLPVARQIARRLPKKKQIFTTKRQLAAYLKSKLPQKKHVYVPGTLLKKFAKKRKIRVHSHAPSSVFESSDTMYEVPASYVPPRHIPHKRKATPSVPSFMKLPVRQTKKRRKVSSREIQGLKSSVHYKKWYLGM